MVMKRLRHFWAAAATRETPAAMPGKGKAAAAARLYLAAIAATFGFTAIAAAAILYMIKSINKIATAFMATRQ
jgi:hypothetical protein